MSVHLAVVTLLVIEPILTLTRAATTFVRFYARHGFGRAWREYMGIRGILFLPDELLLEVVKQLEWKEILCVRQTCKRLNQVSRSIAVWRTVVAQQPAHSVWLDCPVNSYSADNLESIFLRRKRVEAVYELIANGESSVQRFIPFDLDQIFDGAAHLLRGGRWLLFATMHGSVIYYDLDSQNPTPHNLIPERVGKYEMNMTIDMDTSSPTLKFNVAISLGTKKSHILEVWRVDLVLDDSGRGTGLIAERLVSIDQEPRGACSSVSLVGEQLAYTLSGPTYYSHITILIDWRTVHGPGYRKRILHPSCDLGVHLILPDILLVAHSYDISLVHSESLLEVITLPHFPHTIPPHSALVTVPMGYVLEDSFSGGAPRFLVYADDGIHGIKVSRSLGDTGDYSLEVIKLLDMKFRPESSLPIQLCDDFMVVRGRLGEMDLIYFSWTENGASASPVAHLGTKPFRWPSFQLLDIQSGRLVVEDKGGFTIFELASTIREEIV